MASGAGEGKKGKKRKVRNDYEAEVDEHKPQKIPRTLAEKDSHKRLIVVLEKSSLETVKVLCGVFTPCGIRFTYWCPCDTVLFVPLGAWLTWSANTV